jgi:hypothetical protein
MKWFIKNKKAEGDSVFLFAVMGLCVIIFLLFGGLNRVDYPEHTITGVVTDIKIDFNTPTGDYTTIVFQNGSYLTVNSEVSGLVIGNKYTITYEEQPAINRLVTIRSLD